jgi:hypothetical protein
VTAERREQDAKIMRGAADRLGGGAALALRLEVEGYKLAEWMAGTSDAPRVLVSKAIDIIVATIPPKSKKR